MEILKFESGKNAPRRSPASQKNKTIRLAVAIGAVALVGVLSSTLASNISINSGGNVEFGQGISGAAACDSALTITPQSTFVNNGGTTGTFNMSSVVINDSATTADTATGLSACAGKYLRLSAYDSSSATPLYIGSSSSGGTGIQQVEIYIATAAGTPFIQGSYVAAANSTGLKPTAYSIGVNAAVISLSSSAGSRGQLTLNLGTGTGVATSGQIYKLTVESHS